MAAAKKETAEKMNDLFIMGRVVRAYYGATRKDEKEKYRITIQSDVMPYDQIKAFDGSPSRFVPSWFKEEKGFMNLSSDYAIPVRYGRDELDFTQWSAGETNLTAPNAIVVVKVRQKQGAVYPVAIDIREDGHTEDVWEGFDE